MTRPRKNPGASGGIRTRHRGGSCGESADTTAIESSPPLSYWSVRLCGQPTELYTNVSIYSSVGQPLQATASLVEWLRRPPRERKIRGSNVVVSRCCCPGAAITPLPWCCCFSLLLPWYRHNTTALVLLFLAVSALAPP